MTTIVFEDEGESVLAKAGDMLIEHAEPLGCLIVGCAAGHCAACAITVVEGADALEPPTDREYYTLTQDEIDGGARLGCLVVIAREGAHVRVRSFW